MTTHVNTKNQQRLDQLLQDKTKELNITIVESRISGENNDCHILAKRHFDDSYVVWTSYNNGNDRTTFTDFFNGTYDMNLEQGVGEFVRRVSE